MALTVPFKLITPLRVEFDGEADLVIAVGTEGEVGIMPKHAPFLTALKPGVLRANVHDGAGTRRLELATGEGFMQALPDRITVLVDQALAADAVDSEAARRELSEATDRQKAAGSDAAAFAREQAAIDFANAKLRITGR